ncbi:MAG TPA: ATP-binding protein [Candidatus Saccharimonadales bacterium]|nr:ATP-binding protein [Candidatus Saccharimonadales bacterium]
MTPGEKLVAEHPSGALYVAVRGRVQLGEVSRLVEIRDGVARTVHTFAERPSGIGIRGDDVWFASMETYRYRPGGTVERLDPRSDFCVPFSKIFVDREGSLWLGGYDGLVQLPDPDTVAFTAADGLPAIPAHGDLALSGGEIWAGFYDGLGRIRKDPSGEMRASIARRGLFAWDLCLDAGQRVWTYSAPTPGDSSRGKAGILEVAGGGFRFHPVAENPRSAGACAEGEDGRVWFLIEGRLYRTPEGTGDPVQVGTGPEGFNTAFAEQDGRLWVGFHGRLCSAGIDGAGKDRADWECEDLPVPEWIYDVQKMPSGDLWVATGEGIYRRTGGTWTAIAGAPHRIIHEIAESPSGGVWITSPGPALRVVERPDLPAGLEVLERLSMWQGTTSGSNRNILEEANGTLWITGPEGPIRMPPSARFAKKPVPEVALVDALVDGERIANPGEIELPYSRNRVELKFAALTYRDPLLVRYRVRSDPRDEWIETTAPGFHFADLAPGRYQPQVIASLDGEHWTSEPASLSIRVLPPWYRTAWAVALFASLATLALYAAYRARVAVLLRLERQRSRIAMDLHDEIGSGLGSIGLLADLVARRNLEPDRQESIAGKIAATAEELGAKLRDILWSLRTPSPDLQGLASHLGESGGRLFPDSAPRFRTAFPAIWSAATLSLAVRRNLQLIALEAMHNAAKHAGGSAVELGFDASGRIWRMWVEDDGRGMPPETSSPGPEHGIGLEAMRSRASQIGATIRWTPGASGGTRVEVAFRPSAADRRLSRRRE